MRVAPTASACQHLGETIDVDREFLRRSEAGDSKAALCFDDVRRGCEFRLMFRRRCASCCSVVRGWDTTDYRAHFPTLTRSDGRIGLAVSAGVPVIVNGRVGNPAAGACSADGWVPGRHGGSGRRSGG